MNSLIISLIMTLAPHFNIKPEVALSVAKVESSLNPNAIGPLKEVGVFQVRPEYSRYSAKELLNPVINITEGLRILAKAKRRCKHQVDRAWLVCYNLGVVGGSRIKYPKKFPYYVKVMEKLNDREG